jgi:tRNA-dihydrouridine synthase B
MLKPLKIGSILFPVNIIQGPLAGVSCAPFRLLTWRYSKPAFSCTEMISCKTILQETPQLNRYIEKSPEEGPVCFQLSGNNPNEVAEATKRVTQFGADLIDLNCGCPVNKIRSKGAGSKLLSTPTALYQLITAMKKHTHVPVSIKIRVQGNSGEKFNAEIAQVVKDAGADFLIVHGRHWTEHYETPCRYTDIQFFVDQLSIPVIGNGDIRCVTSLKKMFATGCAGVMIARAGVGQPWLIQTLIAEMQGNIATIPDLPEVGRIFIEHIEKLSVLLNSEKFAVLQARKLAKYYGRKLTQRTEFCAAMNGCEEMGGFKQLCGWYFG